MPPGCAVDTPYRLDNDLAKELAAKYGTPLYVLSEECIRIRMREYKLALEGSGCETELSYASKANSTLAVLRIAFEEGLLIDVASEGELRAALLAGVPASSCEFHGNDKSDQEIRYALASGVRTIVADSFEELDTLGKVWSPDLDTRVILRLAPGVDPQTHEKISTGQEDSKFGFNVSDGAAEQALLKALSLKLPVVGFHCHVGSQLLTPDAQIDGSKVLVTFALTMYNRHRFVAKVINAGGGRGVRYGKNEDPQSISEYCGHFFNEIEPMLGTLPKTPVVMLEPGRSVVGDCAVTVYTVGAVKTVPTLGGHRTYVIVDGGLSDNPRPALYGASFELLAVSESKELSMTCTVSGRHCETDELFRDVTLPADVAKGDLVQVLATGAYTSSMASNYNRYPRPATVLVRSDGSHSLVQRREDWDSMFMRETMPGDL